MRKKIFCLLLIMSSISFANERYLRDDSKEIVLDTRTNLVWQDNNKIAKNWEDAITYCENLTLADSTDWKLPNINELYSIVDRSQNNLTINGVFKNTDTYYWSSTTVSSSTSNAWVVSFSHGVSTLLLKSGPVNIRCVRVTN